jgi:hypothetical protein
MSPSQSRHLTCRLRRLRPRQLTSYLRLPLPIRHRLTSCLLRQLCLQRPRSPSRWTCHSRRRIPLVRSPRRSRRNPSSWANRLAWAPCLSQTSRSRGQQVRSLRGRSTALRLPSQLPQVRRGGFHPLVSMLLCRLALLCRPSFPARLLLCRRTLPCRRTLLCRPVLQHRGSLSTRLAPFLR